MSGQRRGVPPGGRLAGDELDLAPGMGRDAARQLGDRDLLRGADVIDAEMLAFLAHHHDAGDEIVDEAEAARLLAGALDVEAQRPGRLRCAASLCRRNANCGITCSQPMSGP